MRREPHPTLPNTYVTTPVYVGTAADVTRMQQCRHTWPEGLPERMDQVNEQAECGMQRCTQGCGASRAIYRIKEAPDASKQDQERKHEQEETR